MRFFCLLLAAAVLLSGCAVAPPPSHLLASSDPRARVPRLVAVDASAGTVTFRPTGPKGWGEPQTDAPKPKEPKP